VIVRYLGSSAGTGGTVSSGSGTASGYTLHKFTSGGTLSLNALNVVLSGTIGGTGSMVANAAGGKFSLAKANEYSGGSTVSAGTLAAYNNITDCP